MLGSILKLRGWLEVLGNHLLTFHGRGSIFWLRGMETETFANNFVAKNLQFHRQTAEIELLTFQKHRFSRNFGLCFVSPKLFFLEYATVYPRRQNLKYEDLFLKMCAKLLIFP